MDSWTDSDRGMAAGFEAEALEAELTERAEMQTATIAALEAEAAELRGEREQLMTRLVVAERWLSELARRVEEAEAQQAARPLTLRERITAGANS